jgi:uncharacterized protein with HEPN domain
MEIFYFQYSIAFCLGQIGELAGHCTKETQTKISKQIPVRTLVDLRNLIDHEYGTLELLRVWNSAIQIIPHLQDLCNNILNKITDSTPEPSPARLKP